MLSNITLVENISFDDSDWLKLFLFDYESYWMINIIDFSNEMVFNKIFSLF